jgi:hypothetical protein
MKALIRVSMTIILVVAFCAGMAIIASAPIVASSPLPWPTKPCPRGVGVR